MRKTTKKCGSTRLKLAALLQHSFPKKGDLEITWEADHLFPATGSYRSNINLDCCRWTAYAKHYRADGSSFTIMSVHSYTTMTELIKYKELYLSDSGEVYGE